MNEATARLRFAARLALLTVLAISTGCDARPLGTRDVELTYSYSSFEPLKGRRPDEDLEARVRWRLGAGSVTADLDVDAEARRLAVLVERNLSGTVDHLLRWQGGVVLHAPAPDVDWRPRDPTGLAEVSEPRPDGGIEHYYVGAASAVGRAIFDGDGPEGHLVMYERLDHVRWRTRVVGAAPIVDLHDAILRVDRADGGRALSLTFTKAGHQRLAGADLRRPLAVVEARRVLGVRALEPDEPLALAFGDDLYAYAEAHATERRLKSPPLPPLERTGKARLRPDVRLAIASLVAPLLLSIAWIWFVRRFDRAQPEPRWLVAATFVLGGASLVPAWFLEAGAKRVSPWLDPHLVTLGGQVSAFPLALVVTTLVVGVVEEGAKLLGAWTLAGRRREFDQPIDGIVYGAASSVGFAAAENFEYLVRGRLGLSSLATRGLVCVPGHMFLGALWGYALGQVLVTRSRARVALFFAVAAVAHGAYDTLCSIPDLAIFAKVLQVCLAVVFVALVRRALRHGVIDRRALRPPGDWPSVPIGQPVVFWIFAALMCGATALLESIGIEQAIHPRETFAHLAESAALVLALGALAYALTETMPLDVVIDDHGVTLAGAMRPCSAILAMKRQRTRVVLSTTEGPLLLGPAGRAIRDRLVDLLRERGVPLASESSGRASPRGSR